MGDTNRRFHTFSREEMVIIRKIKCPERQCRKRVCDIGETVSGWIIVSLKCPNCGRVVKVYWKPSGKR